MAYPDYQIVVPLLATTGDSAISANSTAADVAWWYAGPQQYIVRAVAIQHTTTAAWATGAAFSFRKVCGKYTSASGNQIAKITTAATGLREDSVYFNNSFTPTKIPAGYGIALRLTVAATTKLCRAYAIVEPSWERLQNLSTGYFRSVTG